MRYLLAFIKQSHPEEAAKRPSRRAHSAAPGMRYALPRTLQGIAVRNGSISKFLHGVELSFGFGNVSSIVEGLRVSDNSEFGIVANGIIRGNTVNSSGVTGIIAFGVVTGNYVIGNSGLGMSVGGTVSGNEVSFNRSGIDVDTRGSTVIGNTATQNTEFGIRAQCPANLIDNTAIDNGKNLETFPPNGEGCHIEDNLAP
jgi:parallel beta-helix repeat protein